jgi:alanine racemase
LTGQRSNVATIRLAAIRSNFAQAVRCADGREVIAVVKSDAYGHGAARVAATLIEAGCREFAVIGVDEAVVLRDSGVRAPILVLGGVIDAVEAGEAVARDLTPVVHHAEHLRILSAAASDRQPLGVHVEVDSAMRRMGVAPDEAPALLEAVAKNPHLTLAGVYSHFACADQSDLAPSLDQVASFRRVLAAAGDRGVQPGRVHMANSAALMAPPELRDALPEAVAVRPGLMLYGANPTPHRAVDLEPAMTLSTRVAQLRRVRAGETVGYGGTHRASREATVATLPIGYADGVPYSAANRGHVLLGGKSMPVVGRISMNYITVDVGDGQVAIGDEAILFGVGQGGARLPVEDAASDANTIPYDLFVRVGPRVKRVVLD